MRRFTTARRLTTFSIPTTPRRTCGPTPRIGRRRPRRSSLKRACEAASTAGRAGESPYRSGRKRQTERVPKCARVEHVFGHQHTSMGGKIVRTIGLVRAKAKIGLMNLVYNISRLALLERTATLA